MKRIQNMIRKRSRCQLHVFVIVQLIFNGESSVFKMQPMLFDTAPVIVFETWTSYTKSQHYSWHSDYLFLFCDFIYRNVFLRRGSKFISKIVGNCRKICLKICGKYTWHLTFYKWHFNGKFKISLKLNWTFTASF